MTAMTRPSFWTSPKTVFTLLMLAFLGCRVHLLLFRIFDPDEFEHLHASFCIAQGLVPYRDYFEHHGPLSYYLIAPLVWLWGPEAGLLLVDRFVSLGLVLLTLLAVAITARRYSGGWGAVFAVGWLITLPCFSEKSVEWRPDVPAMCLLAWAAYFLKPTAYRKQLLVGGLLLGCAALCTQKVLFFSVGMGLGVCLLHFQPNRRITYSAIPILTGALLPGLLFLGIFAGMGALDDVVRCLIEYPARWPTETGGEASPIRGLYRLLGRTQFAPGHFGLAVFALVAPFSSLATLKTRTYAPLLLACLFHFLALPLVPAVYLQYFLLVTPGLAVLIAAQLFTPRLTATKFWLFVFSGILFWSYGTWQLVPAIQDFLDGFPDWQRIVYTNADILYALVLPVAFLIALCLPWRRRFICLLLLVPGIYRTVIPQFYWPTNKSQFEQIEVVHRLVGPDEKVLDGFSGLGCLRPHATYFWWINAHSIPLMKQERALDEVFKAVAIAEPTLVILDPDLDRLRDFLGPVLSSNYQAIPTSRKDVYLMLRNDKPVPDDLLPSSPDKVAER